MCGRFSQAEKPDAWAVRFAVGGGAGFFTPRYNIAPTQNAWVVVQEQAREFRQMRWGLVPFWARDAGSGGRLINARAETVSLKPAFKRSWAGRRCLVPADGFYEWRREGRDRQPFRFVMASGEPFAMAGLWDGWRGPDGHELQTFTIVTTEANELLATVHDRMPVILRPGDYALWLDPAVHDNRSLLNLLAPYPANEMKSYPVSQLVNNPRNDTPACFAPMETHPPLAGLG